MQTVKGWVSAVIFRNKENLYTVFDVTTEGRQLTCVGYPPVISEGESVELEGETTTHPVYGEQLKVSSYRPVEPEGTQAVLRYLSSGAIKGIGRALADRIVRKFGEDTMRILDEEPERLAEVRGISAAGARAIAAQLGEKRDTRDALIYLQRYGLGGQRALKIWETYGPEMYTVLRENPYRLAEDIAGIGFATADEIASRTGIAADADFRIRSGLMYLLSENLQEGSSYLPEPMLMKRAVELLQVPEEPIRIQLQNLAAERKVRMLMSRRNLPGGAPDREAAGKAASPGQSVFAASAADDPETAAESCDEQQKEGNPDVQVYSAAAYRMEQDIARRLLSLDAACDAFLPEEEIERRIRHIETNIDIHLDSLQHRAVQLAATRGVLLISGGPGTGKTTTIHTIIRYFLSDRQSVLLAAPTGRAAKRMSEATGHEAMTIHRMLGYRQAASLGEAEDMQPENGWCWDRNEENPLEADVVIVDEMSMVDLYLMRALLHALRPGTKLIMVGDADQLPSVGPGRIFGDLMACGTFECITLHKIFRQAQESDIVMNAHRILHGEPLRLDNHSRDFFFLERSDPQVIYKHMVMLIRDKLPRYIGGSSAEIQVLTPMRRGPLGALRLNEVLQSVLNPPAPDKEEVTAHEVTFRVGDKVMQTRNNYQIEWEIPGNFGIPLETGTGIFNGDFGMITQISREREMMTVCFDEKRQVCYPFGSLEDLELAYAITVHKSQGSEYSAVVLPLLSGPQVLLYRNLLYTAVTRARSCVVILGSRLTLQQMEDNVRQNDRFTGLADRIQEMADPANVLN